jgi:hypothetical protein
MILLFVLSHVVGATDHIGMIGRHPHVRHWLRLGLANFLPQVAWNCTPLDLSLLSK